MQAFGGCELEEDYVSFLTKSGVSEGEFKQIAALDRVKLRKEYERLWWDLQLPSSSATWEQEKRRHLALAQHESKPVEREHNIWTEACVHLGAGAGGAANGEHAGGGLACSSTNLHHAGGGADHDHDHRHGGSGSSSSCSWPQVGDVVKIGGRNALVDPSECLECLVATTGTEVYVTYCEIDARGDRLWLYGYGVDSDARGWFQQKIVGASKCDFHLQMGSSGSIGASRDRRDRAHDLGGPL